MNWPVILKKSPKLNQTLSTIKYDKFGIPTGQLIFVCDTWEEGFAWAKENHTQALFVNSGTMFTDWHEWKKLISRYPHKGLIAHLIKYTDQLLHLNDQCWFMNLDKFDITDFTNTQLSHVEPVCSVDNLHDNYTPLWAKPGTNLVTYTSDHFGQGLIAKQLSANQAIVNWNNSARDLKFFIYTDINLEPFNDYKAIAENQLWVFNNEPIQIVNKEKLVSPGSGLSWIFNIITPVTTHIQIVDISSNQIKFCQEIWNTWDGNNYGEFVWEFIKNNNVVHYEIDNPVLSDLDRLILKGKSRFIQYANNKFLELIATHNIDNFNTLWQTAKLTKTVNFCNDNLIHWVLNNDISIYDNIWCSNILDYKWTLLHTSVDDCRQFLQKIQ
jgi:hypothetical protein